MQRNRLLIIVPVIHVQADMGSLRNRISISQKNETMATQLWQAISEYVQELPVIFSELRVYQDGLPDVSPEMVEKIVDATPQSPNFNLLRWLKDKGAKIIGTESPSILLEENRALQAIVNANGEKQIQLARLNYIQATQRFLRERDKYIAKRIKATLPEGGTGILFIGIAHEVKRLLENEIEVTEPETLLGLSPEFLREAFCERERA